MAEEVYCDVVQGILFPTTKLFENVAQGSWRRKSPLSIHAWDFVGVHE